MRAKVFICDVCKEKIIGDNRGDIKIKYRAERKWWAWYESGWERIDICAKCLKKIISAKEEHESE